MKSRIGMTTLGVLVTLSGCGGGGSPAPGTSANALPRADMLAAVVSAQESPYVVQNAKERCQALLGTQIPMVEIGLPSRGAVVTSAILKDADAGAGLPEHCQVQASVLAAGLLDYSLMLQANLPTTWNRKALQFGGGGFNGVLSLADGTGNFIHAPTTTPKPLAQGYLTFGSDGGHQGTPFTGEFAMNAEALANYAGESVKRTHDAALAVARRYYQAAPSRTYYHGGSKGGHEGLVAAQRYASDYDGVVAYYPASQNQALVLNWFRMWEAAWRQPGGSLTRAKRQLLHTRVLEACDSADGIADGIVANLAACDAAFSVDALRCEGGADTGDTCMSDTQIATLKTAAVAMRFAFPLANGVTTNGPYPVFTGGDLDSWLEETLLNLPGGVLLGLTGVTVPNLEATTGTGLASSYGIFTDNVIRYFIQQNPASTTYGFDYRAWQPRVEQISRLYDASNPDLDALRARGGKLIVVQGTTDMLVPHTMTTAYFKTVQQRYGGNTKSFARYFVQPGFGHSGGYFNMTWDSLAALEAWVERGQAPSNPVAVSGDRAMPLCEFPTWAKYTGGDPKLATSFACRN